MAGEQQNDGKFCRDNSFNHYFCWTSVNSEIVSIGHNIIVFGWPIFIVTVRPVGKKSARGAHAPQPPPPPLRSQNGPPDGIVKDLIW